MDKTLHNVTTTTTTIGEAEITEEDINKTFKTNKASGPGNV